MLLFLSIIHAPGSLLDLTNWLQGGNADFLLSILQAVSLAWWISWKGEAVDCECKMHGLVETWWCSDVDVPAGSVFQGVFSLNTQGLLTGSIVFFSGLVSLCQCRDHPDQAGCTCSTDWQGKFSLTLHFWCTISFLPSSIAVYCCYYVVLLFFCHYIVL